MQNENLFLCVGGNNGYNGADHLHTWGVTGGGATHIAKNNRGILKNYLQYKDEVLIVAGGGGGNNDGGNGGAGGGLLGENGIDFMYQAYNIKGGSGGSQTTGGISTGTSSQDILVNGTFGEGGYAYTSGTSPDYGAIGGSGWYGGGGTAYSGCSGGGSGHININYVINGSMENGVRVGDGYAIVTLLPN